jgi:outer membrane protein TolC
MRIRNTILLALFLGFVPAKAQENVELLPLSNLTLDRAIAFSLKNSPELNIQNFKRQQDQQELSRVRQSKIPNVYLSGDVRHNLIIPTTPIPDMMMNPEADPGQILYMKFSTRWTSGTGINLSYDIFNPATASQVSEQKQQVKINSYDTKISEIDIRTSVAQAYAECVVTQAQLENLKNDTAYYHESVAEARSLFEKEKLSLQEKNSVEMAYNTSIIQYLQAEQVFNSAKANLLYWLGIEVSEKNIKELHLSEDIPALYSEISPALPERKTSNSSADSPTNGLSLARQAEVIALAGNRIKSASLKYAPTLSLNGYYGTNYYGNDFKLGNDQLWHGNSYVALSLKMPITQAFTTRKEISGLKLQEQIERENLRKITNQKTKELTEASSQLLISEKEYEINRKNYDLSTQNLKASQASYEKGYLLNKDLLSEQAKCRNAYQSFLQAAYNVFSNAINLQKIKEE